MSPRLRWEMPHSAPPKHPYRDTLIVYGFFAVIVVVVAWATGGSVGRAFAFAGIFFLVACGWSWSRWHRRLRDPERRRQDGLS